MVTKDSRLDFISREAVLLILHSDTLVCFQALQNILGGKFLKHAPNRLRRTERSQPVTIRNRSFWVDYRSEFRTHAVASIQTRG